MSSLYLGVMGSPSLSPSARAELASDVLRSARAKRSDVGLALVTMVLHMSRSDPERIISCADILKQWDHAAGVATAVSRLWEIANSAAVDCYPRVRALQAITELSELERRQATDVLRELLAAPVTDGRQHWLVLEALSTVGEEYSASLRSEFFRVALAPTASPTWIVRTAELARGHGDDTFALEVGELLRKIWLGRRPNSSEETPGWSERESAVEVLRTTALWPELKDTALANLQSKDVEKREDWFAIRALTMGASSVELLKVVEQTLQRGTPRFRPWHILLDELDSRGWRIQVRHDRSLVVLREGQGEARTAGAKAG